MVVQNRKCDWIATVSSNALFRDRNSAMVQTLYRKCDLLRSKCLDFHGKNREIAVGLCYQRCFLWVLSNAPWYSAFLARCWRCHLFLPNTSPLPQHWKFCWHTAYEAGDWCAEPTKWWMCRASEDTACPKEEFWGRISALSITENRCSLQSLGGKLIWLLLAKFSWWLVNKMRCPRDCETKPSGNTSKE